MGQKNSKHEIVNLKMEIVQLKKKVDALRSINNSLMIHYTNTLTNSKIDRTDLEKKISKDRINEYVDQLLKDSSMDISYLPSLVEKQIYKNVITLIIDILTTTIDSTNIHFMGHDLVMKFTPSPN